MKTTHAKIRERDRYVASPKEGEKGAWTEYQLVAGRKVLSRHDTLKQAQEALVKMQSDD